MDSNQAEDNNITANNNITNINDDASSNTSHTMSEDCGGGGGAAAVNKDSNNNRINVVTSEEGADSAVEVKTNPSMTSGTIRTTPSTPTLNNNNNNCTSTDEHEQEQSLRNRRALSSSPLKEQLRGTKYDRNSHYPSMDNRYHFPRLVRRNLPYFQSHNILQVENNHQFAYRAIRALLVHDMYHVFLRLNIFVSVGALLGLWTLIIIIFAYAYMMIDRYDEMQDCGLGDAGNPITFGPAFAFSLETCTTVGYGLPSGSNSFFEAECQSIQFVIYLQMVWSMMFNAFLFAFFYTRLGKCESRAVQVVFSNQAIIKYNPYTESMEMQVRCYDIDARYPVVEAHIRMYVVTKTSPIPKPLRVICPNDDLGSMLFMSLPTTVKHHIDYYSMLAPNNDRHYNTHCSVAARSQNYHPYALCKSTRLQLRSADGQTNSRDDFCCPVCSESYGTLDRLKNHIRYCQLQEKHDEYEVEGTHQEVNIDDIPDDPSSLYTVQQLQDYFHEHISEVICVVEGIDPLASGTFQALQSYRYEDIVFGQFQFQDCIQTQPDHSKRSNDKRRNRNSKSTQDLFKKMVVDLEKFHVIIPETDKNYTFEMETRQSNKPNRRTTQNNNHNNANTEEKIEVAPSSS